MGSAVRAVVASALLWAASARATDFNPAPWLADLEQARQAFHEKYANWDWVETEHGVKIDSLFDDSAARLRKVTNESDAKAVFARIASKLDDGHVEFDWPDPPRAITTSAPTAARDLCDEIGFNARQNGRGALDDLPGYIALAQNDNPFAAGLIMSGGTKVGIVRIGVFQPQGYPRACRAAVRELAIATDKSCEDPCRGKIIAFAYDRLTAALEQQIRQLRSAGATILLIDISHNGGGSEWAEAVARMLTPRMIVSEQRGFVRGDHWVQQWRDLGKKLRSFATAASASDRKQLLGWASEADAALVQAEMPCPISTTSCERIAKAGFATGLVGAAHSDAFAGRPWATDIFSPSQFHYHDGVWDGPLIILTDQETWSAAEEFAAVLQDNEVAVILGARTGGAGCGHTNGGTPTTLNNSGAVLELPDCVRFRGDGSNEVRGILPDIPVAIRADDGAEFRARLILEKLPAAIAAARALNSEH